MKFLEAISLEDMVAIDIETVRIAPQFRDLCEDIQEAWAYKNKQDGQIPPPEELSSLWERNASLYAEFSKVCAISLVTKHDGYIRCKEFGGEDELLILNEIEPIFQKLFKNRKRLVAHAGKYFDYPFLCKRYVINGIQIPHILDTVHLKPWEQTNICTNQDIWKMGGLGAGSSLRALCAALEIPTSKSDLVGDEVGQAYYNGEIKRIMRYCSHDAIATFNIVSKIKREPIVMFEDVAYV